MKNPRFSSEWFLGGGEQVVDVCCQVIFATSEGSELLVDVIALEPLHAYGESVPPGLPITVGLARHAGLTDYGRLVETLIRWADSMAVFKLTVLESGGDHRIVLSRDDEVLILQISAT